MKVSFDASSKSKLLAVLARTDIRVAGKTEGRRNYHCESWTICGFLSGISDSSLLSFPLTSVISHTDSPARPHIAALTTMTELEGFEEKKGATRPKGVQHGVCPNRQSWLERKSQEAAELGVTNQPYCLIIGGGQGGIALGARLKQLEVPTIIIEKNDSKGVCAKLEMSRIIGSRERKVTLIGSRQASGRGPKPGSRKVR
jgi:hypothetical protein